MDPGTPISRTTEEVEVNSVTSTWKGLEVRDETPRRPGKVPTTDSLPVVRGLRPVEIRSGMTLDPKVVITYGISTLMETLDTKGDRGNLTGINHHDVSFVVPVLNLQITLNSS